MEGGNVVIKVTSEIDKTVEAVAEENFVVESSTNNQGISTSKIDTEEEGTVEVASDDTTVPVKAVERVTTAVDNVEV